MRRTVRALFPTIGMLVAGCGGDGPSTPSAVNLRILSAVDLHIEVLEDSVGRGILRATDTVGSVSFVLERTPDHGSVSIWNPDGRFEYMPDQDFVGTDSFAYAVVSGGVRSAPAVVTITVQNVNDAPVIESVPDMGNSAYSHVVRYTPTISDVDKDELTVTATTEDENIATVQIDPDSHELHITPISRGQTAITIAASDGKVTTSTSFSFTVEDVTKLAYVADDGAGTNAISLVNTSDRDVELRLTHNGFPQFLGDDEMLEYVRMMPPEIAGEPFERKLWRFLRDNVYHGVPLSADRFQNDPWIAVSSLGWGFCGQVASSYVRLARRAGYDARVRGLTGHVVPEIWIDGAWRVYDPDLGVYYWNRNLQIAGVDELAADAELIVSPIGPVPDPAPDPMAYSPVVADIYSTTDDNYVADHVFLTREESPRLPTKLPAGARFVYPGNWTSPPIGYDGNVPYVIESFRQGMLVLPEGWTGTLPIPWMIADIWGDGRIKVADTEEEIGSVELTDLLKGDQTRFVALEVLEARSEIQIIFFINAVRYRLLSVNEVSVTGVDVWAVEIGTESLPVEYRLRQPGIVAPTPLPSGESTF